MFDMFTLSAILEAHFHYRYIAVIKGPHNKKFTSAMLFGVWCNGWLGMDNEYKESMA
jgi:hypothetical protein